jgi:hypothetical protein
MSNFEIAVKRTKLFAITNDPEISGNTRAGATLITDFPTNKFYIDNNGDKVLSPHYGKIKKVQDLGFMLATHKVTNAFQNATNRALLAAGEPADFVVQPHRYADQVGTSAVMVHRDNGQVYLRYYPNSKAKTNSYYTFEGNVIAYDDIKGKKPVRANATVTGSDNGTVVEKPQYRMVKIENISSLRVNGKAYDQADLA